MPEDLPVTINQVENWTNSIGVKESAKILRDQGEMTGNYLLNNNLSQAKRESHSIIAARRIIFALSHVASQMGVISDTTTARLFTLYYWQGLSKIASRYNNVFKNWVTTVKDFRDMPGSWIKWNMMMKPVGSQWIDFLCTNKGAHSTNGNTDEITLLFPDGSEEKFPPPALLSDVLRSYENVKFIIDADNKKRVGGEYRLEPGAVYTVVLKDLKMDVEAKEPGDTDLKRQLAEAIEKGKEQETEIKRLKLMDAFSLPSTSTKVESKFPPAMDWDISKEFEDPFPLDDIRKIWDSVQNLQIPAEIKDEVQDLNPMMKRILEAISSTNLFCDDSKDRKNASHIPDFAYYSDNTQKFELKTHRERILVDIELKRRFSPPTDRQILFANTFLYPASSKEAYAQMLNRAREANLVVYYCVLTDLDSIVFWKITQGEKGWVAKCSPNFQFYGEYKLSGKGKDTKFSLTIRQPTPLGFQLLVNFISFRMKGSGNPSLLIVNDRTGEERTFHLIRNIGKGKKSIVYCVRDFSTQEDVCLKMEPQHSCGQINNEIEVLQNLKGCVGVPLVLFQGKTTYEGQNYVAIVTDIVGRKSLKDIISDSSQFDEDFLLSIANSAIDIVEGIHSRDCIYGDFKPDHFIFSDHQFSKMYLIDYGSTRPVKKDSKSIDDYSYITPRYSSSEGLLGLPLTFESDFKSLWVVLLAMFQQELPFDPDDYSERIHFIDNLKSMYSPLLKLFETKKAINPSDNQLISF